jgi:hypothetical protein
VSLLAGGLAGWTADGGELFEDVNAPSNGLSPGPGDERGTLLRGRASRPAAGSAG